MIFLWTGSLAEVQERPVYVPGVVFLLLRSEKVMYPVITCGSGICLLFRRKTTCGRWILYAPLSFTHKKSRRVDGKQSWGESTLFSSVIVA